MPINNTISSGFKTVKIGSKYVIAEDVSLDLDMQADGKHFIQGTIKNQIMDIGGFRQTISIRAPILIGSASKIDGRSLLGFQLTNALLRTGNTLPILKSAEIAVNGDQGATVSLTMESDGDPTNANVIDVKNEASSALTDGITADILNPSTNTPARVARFYDFRVKLAGVLYRVLSARIRIEIEIKPNYFIAGNDGSTDNGTPVPVSPNSNNFGTQIPTLMVSGIKVSGSGTAAEEIDVDSNYLSQEGAVTVTGQTPGNTVTAGTPVLIEVYNALTSQWVNLFDDPANPGTPLIDMSKSVINRTKLNVPTAGLITSEFDFLCYVK